MSHVVGEATRLNYADAGTGDRRCFRLMAGVITLNKEAKSADLLRLDVDTEEQVEQVGG